MLLFDVDNVALCAIVTACLQFAFFVVVCKIRIQKVVDIAGGITFCAIALVSLCIGQTYLVRQLLLTTLVCLWAVRLATYLLYRSIRAGGDDRFSGNKENCCRLLNFWTFQAIWVFVVSLPVIFVNAPTTPDKPHSEEFSVLDVVGTVTFIIGFVLEIIADVQRFVFRDNPGNDNKWCMSGLWKWSRHPNYFGEMLVWWGAFLFSVTTLQGIQWLAIFSPLFTMAILLFLSGIPVLEKKADEIYGSNEDYRLYKNGTSPLIPLPPALYRRLPTTFKRFLCCDLSCYHFADPEDGSTKAFIPTPV